MEVSCKIVKKECLSSSNSLSQYYGMSLSEMQRERRQIRMEIIRCKRAGIACDESTSSKKRRLDELNADSQSVPSVSSSISSVEMDANKVRQLRNRESAERSRLKKDMLVDSLTCQVCELFVQLTDLMNENTWLKNQQMYAMGASSPCYSSAVSMTAEEASIHSAITSCDEYESDSDCDDCSSCSASTLSHSAACESSSLESNADLCLKSKSLQLSTQSPHASCDSQSGSRMFDDFNDEFDDVLDNFDNWFENGALI